MGYETIVPQNNGFFEMFWSGLGLFNDKYWFVIHEIKMQGLYNNMERSEIKISFLVKKVVPYNVKRSESRFEA